jgi:hypothetical protein
LLLGFKIRPFKADLVEQFLHDRVQAARADIFCLFVDAGGEVGDGGDGVFRKLQINAFGLQQRLICA